MYFTKFVLSYAIPDVPDKVKEQIKREKYLTQVLLHEANLKKVAKQVKPFADMIKCDLEGENLDQHLWAFLG